MVLRLLQLFVGGAFLLQARHLAGDHLQGFDHALVLGGGIAPGHGGRAVAHERGADAVGKTTLLTHFLEQARGEGAAAENVVEHIGRNEAGITPCDTGRTETDHRLRNVEIDNDARADLLQGCRLDHGERLRLGQRAENLVEQDRQIVGGNGTDNGDLHATARDHGMVHGNEIVARDSGNALGRAGSWAAVRMACKAFLEEAARGHDARSVLLIAQTRDRLRTHALDGVGIEARLNERETQQLEGFIRMLHERLQRAADGIVACVEGQFDGARSQALLEGVGIVLACTLIKQTRQHLRDARLGFRIMRRSALKNEGDRDQRHHIGFNMPRLDTARGGQRLHGGGGRRQGFDGSGHLYLKSSAGGQDADFCR